MKYLLTLLILLYSGINLTSQESYDDLFSDIDDTSIEEENPLSLSGEFKFEYSIPYEDLISLNRPKVSNNFNFTYLGDNIEIYSNIEIAASNELNPKEIIIPGDNYLKLSFNNTTLKAGYFTTNWGHADGINPTNQADGVDFRNPVDKKRLESVAINLEHYISDLSVEGLYIPKKEKSLFTETEGSIPLSIEKIDPDKSFILGSRVNYYGKADLSLSYIYDIDNLYCIDKISQEGILLINQRIHRIGISSKTTLGSFGLWAEANYSLTEKSGDYLEWIVGFDRNFGLASQGFLNIQFFGSWHEDYKEDDINNDFQNIRDEITFGLTSNVSYAFFNDEITPEVTFVYIKPLTDNGNYVIKPKISYQPIDSLTIDVNMSLTDLADNSLSTNIAYSW